MLHTGGSSPFAGPVWRLLCPTACCSGLARRSSIREFFINDDVTEAIISLTQDLLTGKVRVTPLLSEPQETGA